MNKKNVVTEIIEEDYLILKDEIIRIKGVIDMQNCFCNDTLMYHSHCLSRSDIKIIKNHKEKIRFLYDKFEEMYKFFMKDYPNPTGKMR